MRVRHKPWAADFIKQHNDWVIADPAQYRGVWREQFGRGADAPLALEIGTGKGQFIIEMAKRHPETCFIGLEKQSDVLVMALQQALETELTNLRFIVGDADEVESLFTAGEVDALYLNFSDPWPKRRHHKRRLTHEHFLRQYRAILSPDGVIQFKTDNQALFEYSLSSLSTFGLAFSFVSLDLHHSERAADNVTTEYEDKFAARGNPIYALEAHFPDKNRS